MGIRIILLLCLTALFGQTPIAVIDFQANGISNTEINALTDRLRNELVKIGDYRVIEREMMNDILQEQGFQQTGCTTTECLVEMGELIGVAQIIGGSISKIGAIHTVSARIIDVTTGEVLWVTDYDLVGGVGQLLTSGMKNVAHQLTRKIVADKVPEIVIGETSFNPLKDRMLYSSRWDVTTGINIPESGGIIYFSRRFSTKLLYKDIFRLQPAIDFGYLNYARTRRDSGVEKSIFFVVSADGLFNLNDLVVGFSPGIGVSKTSYNRLWNGDDWFGKNNDFHIFLLGELSLNLDFLSIPMIVQTSIAYHPLFDRGSPYFTLSYNL